LSNDINEQDDVDLFNGMMDDDDDDDEEENDNDDPTILLCGYLFEEERAIITGICHVLIE